MVRAERLRVRYPKDREHPFLPEFLSVEFDLSVRPSRIHAMGVPLGRKKGIKKQGGSRRRKILEICGVVQDRVTSETNGREVAGSNPAAAKSAQGALEKFLPDDSRGKGSAVW